MAITIPKKRLIVGTRGVVHAPDRAKALEDQASRPPRPSGARTHGPRIRRKVGEALTRDSFRLALDGKLVLPPSVAALAA